MEEMKKVKMGKRIAILILMCIISVNILSGCTKASSSTSAEKPVKKLRVGMMPFTGNVPAKYAFDKGWFKEAGLDVEFVMFPNGAPINEALGTKQIDMAVSGLAMVFALANDVGKWVGESNTGGGMGLYVRPNSPVLSVKGKIPGKPDMYGSAETIKGMTFLGQLGTSSQLNVIRYVQQFGLTENDIKLVNIDLGTDLQAFKSGQGDALAASLPFSFQAKEAGFVCAATFEDATDVSLNDGIVARNDVIKERRDEVVKFVREYYRAAEVIAADEKIRFDFSKEYFAGNGRVYSDQNMRDEMVARQYIIKDTIKKPDYVFGQGMISIAKFYSENGKIQKENLPNVPKAFDSSIIKDALGIDMKVAK
jgi:sulfonate transport system substrate-binding protein